MRFMRFWWPMTDADAAVLPKRSAAELAEALRVRAGCLSGEAWEAPATAAMMLEAAEWLAALAAMPRQEETLTRVDRQPGITVALPQPPNGDE